MKPKIFLLLFSVLCTASAFGQTDSIYLHSGMVIGAEVKQTLPYTITYKLRKEEGVKVISIRAIRKITYSQGNKEEQLSPFIVINSEDDWEKVVVLNDKSETAGLSYAGEVAGHGGGKFVDSALAERQSLMQLKKGAARRKCPFIYIGDSKVRELGYVGRRVRKSGVAYKY